MIGVPPHDFDQKRFTHFVAMHFSGPSDQRAMHKHLATRLAASAGLTFLEGVQTITQHGKKDFASAIADYLDSAEYKVLADAEDKRAKKRQREIIKAYGGRDAIMEPSALESRLAIAVSGYPAFGGLDWHFRYDDLSPEIKELFAGIEPVHTSPAAAMAELEEWYRIHRDRQEFFSYDTEWWIDGRKRILEHAVDTWPAATVDDVTARVRLWQMRSEAGVVMDLAEEAEFQRRLILDISRLKAPGAPVVTRTTTERSNMVREMLVKEPGLSNREIARRVSVSPQTVANLRRADRTGKK